MGQSHRRIRDLTAQDDAVVVERKFLDGAEGKALAQNRRLSAVVRERASDILLALIEEADAIEAETWDAIAREFGHEDLATCMRAGFTLRYDWATREALLLKRQEPEAAQGDHA